MSINSIFGYFSYIFNFKGNSLKNRIHSLKVVSSNPGGCNLSSTPSAWVRIPVWQFDYNHVKGLFQWKIRIVSYAPRGIRTHYIEVRRPMPYRPSRSDRDQRICKDWTTVRCAKGYFLYKRKTTPLPLPGIEPATSCMETRYTAIMPQARVNSIFTLLDNPQVENLEIW